MREIKFRGKRKNNGDWVYGFACQSAMDITGELKKPNWFIIDGYMNYYGVIPETIGQFTGLRDKNGIAIYEGDILSIKDEVGNRGQVIVGFELGGFIIFKGLAWGYIGQYDVEINDIEVIDNIHDNKEKL